MIDLADLGAALAQLGDGRVGGLGHRDGLLRDLGGLRRVLGDLANAEFISSTPVATVCTFLLTCSEAAETTLACDEVSSALALICVADARQLLGGAGQGRADVGNLAGVRSGSVPFPRSGPWHT